MPVRPSPVSIQCSNCHWSMIWQPASDVLLPADLPPTSCPKCGGNKLDIKPMKIGDIWRSLYDKMKRSLFSN